MISKDPSNPTLQSFSVTVDWNEQLQQCMASQAKGDSILTQLAIDKLLETKVSDYYKKSSTTCLANVTDSLSYTYANKEYHYTLYYFDQAGNLAQTVPPKGVNVLSSAQVDSIADGQIISWSGHAMPSQYKFNSLNQLTWQRTPDADSSIFLYDSKGRLRFSKNAQQKIDSAYSYSKYDNLGRIIEVGELTTTRVNSAIVTQLDSTSFPLNGISGDLLHDVTLTHYDHGYAKIQSQFTQQNLRNRVAWVEVTNPLSADTVRTYYSYDAHGNVNSLLQSIPGLTPKRTDYAYDLISGKVNFVLYQFGKADQLVHRYDYDSDNRITDVLTSADRFIWNKEANYAYYIHGPLARTELGEYRVQGLDYQYTLQGWIKGVNVPYAGDPGEDGTGASMVGKDVFAYSLGYYQHDYASINNSVILSDDKDNLWTRALENIGHTGLYNGNISVMVTDLSKIGEMANDRTKGMQGMLYRYDQLHRIKKSRSLSSYSQSDGFESRSTSSAYDEDYSYDGNGNILTLQRNDELAVLKDDFNYSYYANSNKLQQHKIGGGTYQYDSIGNLINDSNEGVSITWTPYGKVRTVQKGDTLTSYRYDASGNRIEKKTTSASNTSLTRYLRDAGGNVMTVYNDTTLQEQPIYGSSRLGEYKGGTVEGHRMLGRRTFELSNHLGNVLTTITDKVNMSADSVWTDVTSASDYYPFGLEMNGRNYSDTTYRYGFNGKEKDNSITENDYDFGARIYNSKISRWMSVDVKEYEAPAESPFSFSGNSPIVLLDPDGKFKISIHKEILREALFKMGIDRKWSENLIYGVSMKADIYGAFSDFHFDGRPNFKLVDASWIELNQKIESKMNRLKELNDGFADWKNLSYGIKRASATTELGVLIHSAQDFYSHSNYVELYVQYYKGQNNGALPTEVPLYADGVKIPGFKATLERTTTDEKGKYQGLYTGEFDLSENEFWDVNPNSTNKNTKNPNSHFKTNHDEAKKLEGKLAKDAARRETEKILSKMKSKVGQLKK